MKLHDFTVKPTEEVQNLRSIGKSLSQFHIEPVEEAKEEIKPVTASKDVNGDGIVDGMDAAIMILTQGNKVAHKKIRHHD